MAAVQIPATLLESLEVSLEAQGKLFLRDISKVLDIPYKELLKNVYGSQLKVSFQLTEITEANANAPEPTPCKAIIPHHSSGYICRKPSEQGSVFCKQHFMKQPNIYTKTAESIYGITPTLQNLYIKKDSIIINKEGNTKGILENGVYYEYST